MFIYTPDPHPGRCPNLRPGKDANGYPTNYRCLDYAGTQHVCSFPPEPKRSPGWSGNVSHWPSNPAPWVMPGSEPVDAEVPPDHQIIPPLRWVKPEPEVSADA